MMLQSSLAAAFCACVAGCAAPGATSDSGERVSLTPASAIPAPAASAISIGKSTKADVIAALGKTAAVTFDSGYEVWVYYLKEGAPGRAGRPEGTGATEFVVLFDPSGIVAKTRMRFAPVPIAARR